MKALAECVTIRGHTGISPTKVLLLGDDGEEEAAVDALLVV